MVWVLRIVVFELGDIFIILIVRVELRYIALDLF